MSSFMTTTTSDQKTSMRAGGHTADQYLLIWDNPVVFKAQVATFAITPSFTQVPFDNVTVGAYTDIREGYTVAISDYEDFRDVPPESIFRIRADNAGIVSTSSTININQTSAYIAENQYILVIKEVRETFKSPYVDTTTNTYYKDFAIQFRPLLPVAYGQPTAAVAQLVSGVVEYTPTMNARVTDADATSINTWTWDSDGLPYKTGSDLNDQNPTFEIEDAGTYMPRVTFEDDEGNVGWFTFYLFVVPEDLSSIVNLSFDGASITRDINGGTNASITARISHASDALMQIDEMADYTLCAVWIPASEPTVITDLWFVGRFRNETVVNTRDPIHDTLTSTSFSLEGLSAIMGRIKSARMGFKEKDTPARFDEIKTLTPQRSITYYLTEHTTILNTHGINFDAFDDTFNFPNFSVQNSSALENMRDLAFQYAAGLEWSPTGEFRVARISWYLSTTDRDALTDIMDMTLTDCAVDASGGQLFSITKDYITTVGRMTGGGAYRNADGTVQVVQVITPAVVAAEGNEEGTFNRQVLAADATLAEAFAEMGDRNANNLKASQPRVILNTVHSDGYDWLIPTRSQWFTWTIPTSANNRGRAYTTAQRWTLESVSLQYRPDFGRRVVSAQWVLESIGSGYQVSVSTPIGTTPYGNPIVPVVPGYPNFPPSPDLNVPDSTSIADGDLPPFDEDDIIPWTPGDPNTTAPIINSVSGNIGVLWDETHVWRVTRVGTTPIYTDFTPQNLDGALIRDVKKDPFSNGLWVLAFDNVEGSSVVFKTLSFGDLQYVKATFEDEIDYKYLRVTGVLNKLYVFASATTNVWETIFEFTADSGSAPNTIYGDTWALADSGTRGGVFTSGVGYEDTETTSVANTHQAHIQIDPTTPANITYIQVVYDFTQGSPAGAGDDTIINDGLTGSVLQGKNSATGSNQTVTWTGSQAMTAIGTRIRCSAGGGSAPSPIGSVTIKRVIVRGTGPRPDNFGGDSSNSATRYSSDGGLTWDEAVTVGGSPDDEIGVDTLLAGDTILAVSSATVREADAGGDYSDEPDGEPTEGYIICIYAYGINQSDYIFGQDTLNSNESIYRVDNGSRSDITPYDGSNYGIVLTPNSIHGVSNDNDYVWILARFSSTRKLAYSVDGGTVYAFNSSISNNAHYIRARNANQIVIVETTVWWYSGDGGATLISRPTPGGSLLGFEWL